MGGRGARIPTATPGGGGSGRGKGTLDQNPGNPSTLQEALGKKGRPMSISRAILGANPFYDGRYGEYSQNCQRAVIATEARFRGYNVIASPTYDGDTMPYNRSWADNFKNASVQHIGKTTRRATQNAVEKQMASYGDGARAILEVQWKGKEQGGHVINVIQKKGKTYYYDGQVGKKYNGSELFNVTKTGKHNTVLVRVDNLDFSEKAKEAVRQNPL